MRAAAQFMAKRRAVTLSVNRHSTYLAAVAVAKERERAGGQRVLDGLHLRLNNNVADDASVHGMCNRCNLVLIERCHVREVKSQVVR